MKYYVRFKIDMTDLMKAKALELMQTDEDEFVEAVPPSDFTNSKYTLITGEHAVVLYENPCNIAIASKLNSVIDETRRDIVEIICPNSCNTDYMGHIEIELFKEFQVDVRVTKADTAHHKVLLPERLNTNENVGKAIDIIKRTKKWYE